ncbi:hypothetical protein R6867_17470, partial [Mycobacterium tuberculosis]
PFLFPFFFFLSLLCSLSPFLFSSVPFSVSIRQHSLPLQRQAAAGVARRGAQGSAMQQLRSTTGG